MYACKKKFDSSASSNNIESLWMTKKQSKETVHGFKSSFYFFFPYSDLKFCLYWPDLSLHLYDWKMKFIIKYFNKLCLLIFIIQFGLISKFHHKFLLVKEN